MTTPPTLRRLCLALLAAGSLALSGCTVIALTGAAVGVAVTGASLAVDATVGAVKLTGAAVGAVLPGGDDE